MSVDRDVAWRYERKFLLEGWSLPRAQSVLRLHGALFSPLYPTRWVNNIYFDDRDLSNLHANVDGNTRRHKLRIRWYGELFGPVAASTAELKIKQGLLGTKRSQPLAPFAFDRRLTCQALRTLALCTPSLPGDMRALFGGGLPVLVNRYRRRYLGSADGRFRVTLDSNQQFFPIRGLGNTFLARWTNERDVILELKYDQAHDEDACAVANRFPFRLTKSSKYVSGMLATRFQ